MYLAVIVVKSLDRSQGINPSPFPLIPHFRDLVFIHSMGSAVHNKFNRTRTRHFPCPACNSRFHLDAKVGRENVLKHMWTIFAGCEDFLPDNRNKEKLRSIFSPGPAFARRGRMRKTIHSGPGSFKIMTPSVRELKRSMGESPG